MGLELAIASLAVGLASAGLEHNASRQANREAKDARRDQAYRAGQESLRLQQTKDANDATAAARLARLRQQAAIASGNGTDQTVATGPMGLAATQSYPTGPQPLKKLGA